MDCHRRSKAGFTQWGSDEVEQAVQAARDELAAGTAAWDIDLPASVYAAIREAYPVSAPPFRMRARRPGDGAGVLHDGNIAEMKTGEGKTLVASFACYLNALSGKGVHLITVNEYLAGRDASWNDNLSHLGISVQLCVPICFRLNARRPIKLTCLWNE